MTDIWTGRRDATEIMSGGFVPTNQTNKQNKLTKQTWRVRFMNTVRLWKYNGWLHRRRDV